MKRAVMRSGALRVLPGLGAAAFMLALSGCGGGGDDATDPVVSATPAPSPSPSTATSGGTPSPVAAPSPGPGGTGTTPAPTPVAGPGPSPAPVPATPPAPAAPGPGSVVITTQPASTTVNVGRSATFAVEVAAEGPLSYQWSRGGQPIPDATAATYTTPKTTMADHGSSFNVTVTTPAGPVTSASATLELSTGFWAGVREDGAPGFSEDSAYAVATDAQGNVVLAGRASSGTFDGDAPELHSYAFVAKYSPAGVLQWARRSPASGTNQDRNGGVATDPAGNVYVAGQTSGAFAGQVNAGRTDIAVYKYAPDGGLLWSRLFGSNANDVAAGIAVDAAGSGYVVGTTSGQLPGQAPPVASQEYFIARFDADGNRLWLKQSASEQASASSGYGVEIDAAGNAYLAGEATVRSKGADAFVAKFDPAGNRLWYSSIGGSRNDQFNAIGVSRDGNSIFTGGRTNTDFELPDFPVLPGPCCLATDAFVARLDGAGVLQWVHNMSSLDGAGPTRYADELFGIAVDPSGSAAFLTGMTDGVMPSETSKGNRDLFVARYKADGAREWLRQFGADIPAQGARNDTGRGIALDAVGDVFVAGDAIGSFGTPGRNIDRTDWFVLKLKALDGSLYE